jgi:hypothetical protein
MTVWRRIGEIIRLLNQDVSIGELQTDIEEIGYPRSATQAIHAKLAT